MRRIAVFLSVAACSGALVHCVGDAPASSDDDGGGGGSDSSTSADSTSSDGGGSDVTNPLDTGTDAPVVVGDACIGFTDCPSNVEAANLQLWLRANAGLTCTAGRVALWNDQSGKSRNAGPPTRVDAGGAKGLAPRCSLDRINGLTVPTFGAPNEPDAGNYTQFIDETLDVDDSFLQSSNFTIFVVERRSNQNASWFFGEDRSVPPGSAMLSCGISDAEDAFVFGYTAPSSMMALAYSQVCSAGSQPAVPASAVTSVDEIEFSATTGHVIYSNGTAVYTGNGTGKDLEGPTGGVHGGTVGRGFNVYNENRFSGNIAEVIAYNAALTTPERQTIETYLKRQWGLTF